MSPTPVVRLETSCRCPVPPRAPGFTLLEVLIAASILSVIAVILYGSFFTVFDSIERVDEDLRRLRIANFLVTHFEENISGAYLPPPGTTMMQGVKFVGEDLEGIDGRPLDTLTFYTTAARMGGGSLPGDTKRVAYALIEDGDGRHIFIVYEKPRLLLQSRSGDEDVGSTQPSWMIPMASLDLKYYDGSEWLDSWDSAGMGKLPCGVKIEAHLFEQEFERLIEKMGIGKPVLVMVVSIPLGRSERMRGA